MSFRIETYSVGPYGSMPITRIGWYSEVLAWIRGSSTFSMIWWTSFQLKGFRVLTALQVHKIVEPCGHGIMDLYIGQVPVNSNWLGLDKCRVEWLPNHLLDQILWFLTLNLNTLSFFFFFPIGKSCGWLLVTFFFFFLILEDENYVIFCFIFMKDPSIWHSVVAFIQINDIILFFFVNKWRQVLNSWLIELYFLFFTFAIFIFLKDIGPRVQHGPV